MTRHYIGEIGTEIIVDIGVDITGATPTKLKVTKPDGTEVVWTATVYNSNYLKYTTISGDFNLAGTYILQAELTITAWSGLGDVATFEIYDPFHRDYPNN
jgi:hypothetical protein